MATLLDFEVLESFRELAAEDPEFFRKYFDAFLLTIPKQIEGLHEAMRLQDARKLAQHAHAIKSSCANSGVREMVTRSENLENLGNSGTCAGSALTVAELETLFQRLEREVRALPEMQTGQNVRELTGPGNAFVSANPILGAPAAHPGKVNGQMGTRPRIWFFRVSAVAFVATALFHVAILFQSGSTGRHLFFVGSNLFFTVLVVYRPRFFPFVFSALVLQQLSSHGGDIVTLWRERRGIDWVSILICLYLPALAVAAWKDYFERRRLNT